MIINPMLPLIIIILIGAVLIWLAVLMPTKLLKTLGILTAILMILIGLRPMISDGETTILKNNLDVIFVMDGTLSMLAEDYKDNGKRIDAVIDDIQYVVNEIPGAYYSLIEFDNQSHINLRSTVDANAAATAAKTTHQLSELYARGSNITIFKDDLKKILESSTKKDGRKRIVFLMTDGENTSGEKLENLADLKQYIDGGAVLGYGTQQGGKMKVKDDDEYYYSFSTTDTDSQYLKDWSSYPVQAAISKIDEENLRKMANELGIEYVHMTDQTNLNSLIKQIKSIQNTEDSKNDYTYTDIYYYFCWPLLIALLLMLYLAKKEFI